MNGQEESKKPEIVVRMEQIEKILDEYENSKGLKIAIVPNNIDKYLNMEEEDLHKMSAEECGNAAYLLNKMALYLQRVINKEQQRITWATNVIESMLVKKLNNYSAFKTDDKMKEAIQDDAVAQKLDSIRNFAKQRIDRLSYLPARVSGMANSLDSLQQTKRRQKYE